MGRCVRAVSDPAVPAAEEVAREGVSATEGGESSLTGEGEAIHCVPPVSHSRGFEIERKGRRNLVFLIRIAWF